jgi:hypothetical protein
MIRMGAARPLRCRKHRAAFFSVGPSAYLDRRARASRDGHVTAQRPGVGYPRDHDSYSTARGTCGTRGRYSTVLGTAGGTAARDLRAGCPQAHRRRHPGSRAHPAGLARHAGGGTQGGSCGTERGTGRYRRGTSTAALGWRAEGAARRRDERHQQLLLAALTTRPALESQVPTVDGPQSPTAHGAQSPRPWWQFWRR